MPRRARVIEGGIAYHVLNRASNRRTLFADAGDYQAFEQVFHQAHKRYPVPVLAYCVMPNHWHLVLHPGPREAALLSSFVRWLTLTHVQRWQAFHDSVGEGHLYQGRFKSFPVACDAYLFTLLRYVERNPLRARLVSRAQDWPWSSLYRWTQGNPQSLLADWPIARPANWIEHVNEAQSAAEVEALRGCVDRGRPYGSPAWVSGITQRLGLGQTLRPRGRPRRSEKST